MTANNIYMTVVLHLHGVLIFVSINPCCSHNQAPGLSSVRLILAILSLIPRSIIQLHNADESQPQIMLRT